MKFDFDFSEIVHQELIVCTEDPESFSQLMVDKSVQDYLILMLENTCARFDDITYSEIPQYELAEKYSSEELVKASLAIADLQNIRDIYNLESVEQNTNFLEDINKVSFYLYKVIDSSKRKIVAVKKAQQFKGLASARGRLISWFDDSLKIMDKPVFRLDRDFDLIITSTEVFAVRPNALAYIAEVDEAATSAAADRLTKIGQSISFLSIDKLKDYVSTHKRGAHLVSSIAARDDLKKFSKANLLTACSQMGIQIQQDDQEKIGPLQGHEMPFLELLDNRRYITSLTEDTPKAFIATSRKPAK